MLGLLLAEWKPLAAVLLILGGLAGAYGKGRHDANLACRAAELTAQLAVERQKSARLLFERLETNYQATAEAADAVEREAALAKHLKELTDENASCSASDLDAATDRRMFRHK
jgi:hypothetical protein